MRPEKIIDKNVNPRNSWMRYHTKTRKILESPVWTLTDRGPGEIFVKLLVHNSCLLLTGGSYEFVVEHTQSP